MWKKDGVPEPTYGAPAEPPPRPERVTPAPSPTPESRATIGRSITIRGEVTGDEDLLIQGRIEGSVDLEQHSITIGRDGQVKADVVGHVVTVEGLVEGNLTATEQVILRSTARVQGDITAPRVVLEDGARFRGGIDMGETVLADPRPAQMSKEKQATSSQPVAAARDSADGAMSPDAKRGQRDLLKSETEIPAGASR